MALESYPSPTLKYAVSAGLAKDKKITALLIFLPEILEKFGSTELYGAALVEGSTIFLCRSSLGNTAMECCQLTELKYAIFSGRGRMTKKLRRWNLFLSTVFKHGLLGIGISISIQLHNPYTVGKLSIRRVKNMQFQQDIT